MTDAQDFFERVRHYELQDSKAVIRRYFTQEKFDDLLDSGELYFSPASTFADPLEGFYLERDFANLESSLRWIGKKNNWNDTELAVCTARKAWDSNSLESQKTVVISCWSLGEREDIRMWSEYGLSSPNAVALETTVGELRIALGPDFLFIPVNYDRGSMPSQRTDSLEPFFYKRAKFSWENELRIVANMEMGKRIGTARRVPIAIKDTHCRFVLAPRATPERRLDVIQKIRACGSEAEVSFSSLVTK